MAADPGLDVGEDEEIGLRAVGLDCSQRIARQARLVKHIPDQALVPDSPAAALDRVEIVDCAGVGVPATDVQPVTAALPGPAILHR